MEELTRIACEHELERSMCPSGVAGRYDVVAHARVASNEALAELVTARIATLRGMRSSETLIAFRVYSSGELDAAFELGGD